jgi:outer membrane protein assembly factor BamB
MRSRFGSWRGLSLRSAILVILLPAGARGAEVNPAALLTDAALAGRLLEMGGISKGICSVIGCESEALPIELARRSELVVHVWIPDASLVSRVRAAADAEGLLGKRVVAEKGDPARLPYADNLVDLVISSTFSEADLSRVALREVLRALRPGGAAVLGTGAGADDLLPRAKLDSWLRDGGSDPSCASEEGSRLWARVVKPIPAGQDEWSHWEHGPDNNPVSTDSVIKAPYMTQWLGLPYYITMPAITTAAGGRVFLAMGHIAHHAREEDWLNTLIARRGHNGSILWTKKLPDGYLAHRSAFVATASDFYMIDPVEGGCLVMDPETGRLKKRIGVPGAEGDWKWMALEGGILFALAGKERDRPETTIVRSRNTHWSWGELSKGYYEPQVPWGFGSKLLAYDLGAEKVKWIQEETKDVDSRAMAIGGGKVFLYSPDSHARCLDAATGRVLWTNADSKLRELIEEPGRGLTSTPGFRTSCYCLYTPKALFFEAQTHMNVVAVSIEDGRVLWNRKKTTSNPNMLYLDGNLLVGIGPEGSTLALDPLTAELKGDLGFKKRSCARLTATPDSLFCRGWPEGLTRYDRATKKVLFNGAFRPSCNDGVIGANGLLYAGPWTCDCNLSIMGTVALCSAGDFQFARPAVEAERLEAAEGDISSVSALEAGAGDWPTYRGNAARSAGTSAIVGGNIRRLWSYSPPRPCEPTAPAAAGGLIFLAGSDGKVKALDAHNGTEKWAFATAGAILQPPTVWSGRAYVGSGDGHVYALEAATGRLLWRFRAAPVERRIQAYGALSSTWPVNTGVLVRDGVAYAAAGIIDFDGTYVYALDAITGKIRWENNTSGHLDPELRKGVSAQGILTAAEGRLWMPGGNVISPASYDLQTGRYLGPGPGNGSPQANRGEEIGILRGRYLVLGGRLQYSARRNVVDPGNFVCLEIQPDGSPGRGGPFAGSKIPPAWNEERIVLVGGPGSVPKCYALDHLPRLIAEGERRQTKGVEPAWVAPWRDGSDTVALALAGNAVLAVCEVPQPSNLAARWVVRCLSPEDGRVLWEHGLSGAALAGGLLVDRDGRIVVVLENGAAICFGPPEAV